MDDTTPDVTVGYDDGWIAVTGALAVSMTEQLDRVRTSPAQQQYELAPGQLQVGPTGETPEFLTALDGKNRLPLSPQLREFYGYARWSSGSVTLLEVQDPVDFLDLLTDPQVDLPGVLRSEFTSPGVLVDARGQGLDPSRCALLMVDSVTSSPHSRAYLVFDAPEHSRVGTLIAPNGRSGGSSGDDASGGSGDTADTAEPEVWVFENDHHHYADLRTWLAWRAWDDGPLDGPAGPEEFETAADALADGEYRTLWER